VAPAVAPSPPPPVAPAPTPSARKTEKTPVKHPEAAVLLVRLAALRAQHEQLVKRYGANQLTTYERTAYHQAPDDSARHSANLAQTLTDAEAALRSAKTRLER